MALSEEFTLTTAELSYLQDRKVAYENLANRTGLDGVKSVCLALQQSERYGTPLGQSLRVMAQENRDMRMTEAEKKAAALPPKLTVPMILFFLPCCSSSFSGRATSRSWRCNEPSGARYGLDAHSGHESIDRPTVHLRAGFRGRASASTGLPRQPALNGSVVLAERDYRRTRGLGRRARIVLAAQHLPQIGDVCRRLVGRQIGFHDGLGLGKAALQADHQREVLPHPWIGPAVP